MFGLSKGFTSGPGGSPLWGWCVPGPLLWIHLGWSPWACWHGPLGPQHRGLQGRAPQGLGTFWCLAPPHRSGFGLTRLPFSDGCSHPCLPSSCPSDLWCSWITGLTSSVGPVWGCTLNQPYRRKSTLYFWTSPSNLHPYSLLLLGYLKKKKKCQMKLVTLTQMLN